MKFFIINSFRSMVYIAFFVIIAYGVMTGYTTGGDFSNQVFGLTGGAAQVVDLVLGALGGWVAASVVCGLIVTLLDIRDDINDRLPDARRDD
ncbi:MAG: hypothetical protein V3V03_09950 [Hyphomonadaceae bacterium]